MRDFFSALVGLAQLHRIAEPSEQLATFRQAFSTLAACSAELIPAPLDGIDPSALLESVRFALGAGFFDDLSWLSEAHAAAAMYEIAWMLPASEEKRELGRRVLQKLYGGNAAVFVLLATQLARSSKYGLAGRGIRARVALALDLPIGEAVGVDALALTLIARSDLESEWLTKPSQGALPSRRLAARLLDRAAREVVRRVARGDKSVLSIFERHSIKTAWDRLLADREPLVWRHVASARGQLAHLIPQFEQEIEENLSPSKTPTEWRRAATSLAAMLSAHPQRIIQRCDQLLRSDVFARDPGIAGSLVWGLSRMVEAEPEAAERVVLMAIRKGGLDAIEALLALREEGVGADFGEFASRLALARLGDGELAVPDMDDDGQRAMVRLLENRLQSGISMSASGETSTASRIWVPLPSLVAAARETFVREGAAKAYAQAMGVLGEVERVLGEFLQADESSSEGRVKSFEALWELDSVLFESSTLVDLLALRGKEGGRHDSRRSNPCHKHLAEMAGRLAEHLIHLESEAIQPGQPLRHRSLRVQRLRALLHFVDSEPLVDQEKEEGELRIKRLRATRFLLECSAQEVPSPLRRIVLAAASRACESLIREGDAEVSEVFLTAAMHLRTGEDFNVFAEAAMVPELAALFRAYAKLAERHAGKRRASPFRMLSDSELLERVVYHLPYSSDPRLEALREALTALQEVIKAFDDAFCLSDVLGAPSSNADVSRRSLFLSLSEAVASLARLSEASMRRMGSLLPKHRLLGAGAAIRALDLAASQKLRGEEDAYSHAVSAAIRAIRKELPTYFAEVVADTLTRTLSLPLRESKQQLGQAVAAPRRWEQGLPPWMPPSRVLGGFYVLGVLGSGGVSSVFVARRVEERFDENASLLALKVPEYGGVAARHLREDEFLQMFREEAGALLLVPPHPNLARFVTFDAGVRPKPILVMELVEGPTLERVIQTGSMTTQRAFDALIGVAQGLVAMHRVGVGHLDVKPSNVILRDEDGLDGPLPERAVLVDFGLAGRKIRPGCATPNYGAPE
ncbi:MAG: protein kinase, partial [Sandaracinaceae bacterium]|nr:protein kinase [Sandaracinaceae bacterium]